MKKVFLIILFFITVSYSYSQLPPPVPIYPSGDTCVNYQNVHFNWHHVNGAASYRIQVSSGANVILDVSGIADTFYIPAVGAFTVNTFYYWSLKAYGMGDSSSWASYWHFATCPGNPDPPILLGPPDSSVVSLFPVFDWTDVPGANSYRIQISANSMFSLIVLDISGLTNSAYVLASAVLMNNTLYYWRVNASNAGGTSQWSSVWRFITLNNIGIKQISSEIPDKYMLYQNYPNPFNPNTTVKFQIKDSRFVSLKVFDLLGKEVKALVNEKLSPGIYEVSFDGNNLPSGMYFYTIRSGDFMDTKRMLLVK